jgi:hypothetical protein
MGLKSQHISLVYHASCYGQLEFDVVNTRKHVRIHFDSSALFVNVVCVDFANFMSTKLRISCTCFDGIDVQAYSTGDSRYLCISACRPTAFACLLMLWRGTNIYRGGGAKSFKRFRFYDYYELLELWMQVWAPLQIICICVGTWVSALCKKYWFKISRY